MIIGLVTGIIFAIFLIAGISLIATAIIQEWNSAITVIGVVVVLVFGALLFTIPGSFHTVDAGELAVVKHLGQVVGVRQAGTYFDFWITNDYQMYDSKVQNIDIVEQTYSSDAQTMDIKMTVQYQIVPSKAVDIATNYGSLETLESRLESVSIEQMKSVLATYSATEIIANRASMSPKVSEAVNAAINESYYVNINTVVLTDISFSDAFEKAVEDQMIAEREKERAIIQAEQERETAIIKAEQERETARIQAEAKLLAAKGDADAQKAIADAEAYTASIKIIELARALGYKVTEEDIVDKNSAEVIGTRYAIEWGDDEKGKQAILDYLQYLEYLAKWDGKLPEIVAGDNLSIFIPSSND